MAQKENIQLNFDRLIEAVNTSNDVKQEIKDILNHFTVENLGSQVATMSSEEIFSLYQFRYHLIELKGKSNESFANVVKRLEAVYTTVQLMITSMKDEGKFYIIFTDKEYNQCFGIIY